MNSNNTLRFPRSLQESRLGPYAAGPVHPMPEPRTYGWAWVAWMCIVSIVGLALVWGTR